MQRVSRSVRKSIVGAAETEQLAAALASENEEALPRVLAQIRDENRLQFLSFVDARNRADCPGFPAAIRRHAGSRTLPVPDFISSAMSGKVMASTELLSREDSYARGSALWRNGADPDCPGSRATGWPEATSDDGMVLIAAAPVNTSSGFEGRALRRHSAQSQRRTGHRINDFVFGAGEQADGTAGIVSIFMKRHAHCHKCPGALPDSVCSGGACSADIRSAVLSQGNPYYGRAYVAGSWHLTACKPIRDHRKRSWEFWVSGYRRILSWLSALP